MNTTDGKSTDVLFQVWKLPSSRQLLHRKREIWGKRMHKTFFFGYEVGWVSGQEYNIRNIFIDLNVMTYGFDLS